MEPVSSKQGTRKVLTIDPDSCTNCRSCELACSAFHYKKTNPMRSSIKVIYDFKRNLTVPIMCQQCEEPPCKAACHPKAIRSDPNKDILLLNEEKCIGCNLCIIACPIGGFTIDPVTKKPIMCDLCDGDPQCVKVCSLGALKFTEDFRVGTETRRAKLKRVLETMKRT